MDLSTMILVLGHSPEVDGTYRVVHTFDPDATGAPHIVLKSEPNGLPAEPGTMRVAEPSGELHSTFWLVGVEMMFDGSVLRRAWSS